MSLKIDLKYQFAIYASKIFTTIVLYTLTKYRDSFAFSHAVRSDFHAVYLLVLWKKRLYRRRLFVPSKHVNYGKYFVSFPSNYPFSIRPTRASEKNEKNIFISTKENMFCCYAIGNGCHKRGAQP